MKKLVKPIIVLIILICVIYLMLTTLYKPSQPARESREELYQDVFISLLLPSIQGEVNKYYSEYLTEPPMVAPYTIFVLSAKRPDGYRTFFFRLKLKIDSYIGPHISVGLDYLTLTVDGSGNVVIEKFEHIKSYELPPNYEDIIKEGYKNPIP